MALVGYARVSSVDQNLAVQLDKLKHCDKIFHEQVSATSSKRPRFQACMEYVREGDTLVITRLDRLARSMLDLCKISEDLQRKDVQLQVLDQNLDTNDATGRLLFNLLGAFAQFEKELISERQREGILKAKRMGIEFGRKALLTPEKILALKEDRANGMLIRELMKKYQLSETSVYRYLSQNSEETCSTTTILT